LIVGARLRSWRRAVAGLAAWSILAGTIGLLPAAPHVLALSGPVAEWTFDETSGTTAHDIASTHDGTILGGATWDPTGGHDGSGALLFDGIGDGVEVPNAAALEPSSITITAWMKSTSFGQNKYETLLQKGANACEAGSYGLQVEPSGNTNSGAAVGRWDVAGSDNFNQWGAAARLWDGQWHHIGWTLDPVGADGHFFVDGIMTSGTGDLPLLYPMPTASDLFIGREPVDCFDSVDFNGALDDVRIYNRALSAGEIQAMVPVHSTTTTVTMDAPSFRWLGLPTGVATISPAPPVSVPVVVYDVTDGAHLAIAWSNTQPSTGTAELMVRPGNDGFDLGTHKISVEFEGAGPYQASTSPPTDVVIVKVPNTITLGADATSLTPGASTNLTASLSLGSDSLVTFDELLAGGGTATLASVGQSGDLKYHTATGPLAIGDHVYRASITETDHFAAAESDPITIHVAKVATSSGIAIGGDLQTHHPLTLHANVGPTSPIANPPQLSGTVTFRDGATIVGSIDVGTSYEITLPSMTVGPHSLTVEYSGDAFYGGSTSAPQVVSITPDTVEATSVGIEYTSFYPVVDGYRDLDRIRGSRIEPLSVSIRIYNSSNGLVRSVSLARAAGAYSWAWNGRTSSGTLLAAGKYRVVQTLTDAFGTKKSFTSYATTSWKKLVSHTTYVTKAGSAISAKGTGGTAKLTLSTSTGVAKLATGSNGFVIVGYQFTLPSATVYTSLAFQVYGRSYLSAPPNEIAVQNFHVCPYSSTGAWNEACFERWRGMGTASGALAWTSVAASPTYDRYGRTVRGLVDASVGTVYVYKVRVKVTYATLQ
jgi:hypothetical protein